MKKAGLLLVLVLLVMSFASVANPVDFSTAQSIGAKFLNANTRIQLRGANDLHLVKTYSTERGDAAFYIFNAPSGFVIVAADDCATPILGYSDEGKPFDLENIPIQLEEYLQGFVEQIQYGVENHIKEETVVRQWKMVNFCGWIDDNRSNNYVEPLIFALWDQNCYYNAMCPEDENYQCGHVPAGCSATAMAMIMHYWGYPTRGKGSHTYYVLGNTYPAQTANFSETCYDWANMPNSLTENSTQTEIDAVATLIWHCGVAMDMEYSPTGSAAGTQATCNAFSGVFSYNNSQVEVLGSHPYLTSEQWLAKIKSNLDNAMPIFACGESGGVGHAWVCDGYDANSMLHYNWGWGGLYNGYFAMSSANVLNYNFGLTTAIFDICPQCDGNSEIHVTANVNNPSAGYVIGGGDFSCEQECTLTAIANEGYHFVKWINTPAYEGQNVSVITTDTICTFRATSDRNITAVFAEDGEGCRLVFDIFDSAGNGMNGNCLEVSYGDGTYEQLSFEDGYEAFFVREFSDLSHVRVCWASTWVFHSWSYPYGNLLIENLYSIKFENGACIHENQYEYLGEQVFEFDLDCEDQYTPRTITVHQNSENAGVVTGGGVYFPGETCTLTAIPNEGNCFSCWEENGKVVSTNATYSFIVGITDKELKAVFGPLTIALSQNLEAGGAIDGGGIYNYGDDCTITATANEGYVFLYWVEDGNVISSFAEHTITVIDNMNIEAVFAEEDAICSITLFFDGYNWAGHSMTIDYGNNITENISPDVWAQYPSYSRYVYDNSHISLSWTNGGYTWGFAFDVRYANGTLIYHGLWNDNSQYEFDVDCGWAYAYHNITASATPEGNGGITGAGEYHWGDTCTLIALPADCCDFLYWTENGEVVSLDTQYSFMVNEDRQLEGHFTEPDADYCTMVFELGMLDWYQLSPDEYWMPGNKLVVNYGDGTYEQLSTTWDLGVQYTSAHAVYTRRVRNGNQLTLGFAELEGDDSHENCVLYMSYEDGDTIYRIAEFDNNFHSSFTANCEEGVINESYVIQTVDITIGWNWYSTYIELSDIDGLAMLEEQLGGNAESINSQTSFTMYYGNYGWYGSLTSINNESMYRIKMSSPTTINMMGMPVNPADHPITVTKGWNHIGYLSSEPMAVDDALAGLESAPGDIVKNQSTYAQYYDGYGWYGSLSLSDISPGQGLMYKSVANESKTFTYPANPIRSSLANYAMNDLHWMGNPQAYPTNMTMMAVVEINGNEVGSENYELSAFADGKCRGSVRLQYVEPIDRYVAFLTITGDDEENMSFALYDKNTGMENFNTENRVIFHSDDMIGSFDNPFVVSFGNEESGDVKIYPNPVKAGESVNIVVNEQAKVEIINALGEVVAVENLTGSSAIRTPATAGVYMLRITTGDNNVTLRRVVLQ